MNISILGSGYVGLVTGACFAELGNKVICVDIDSDKVKSLNMGIVPIYEPGLDGLIKANRKENRLTFTTDLSESIKNSDIIFICVGTPPRKDGSVDISNVEATAKLIGQNINSYKLVVVKSTVPVGTTYRVKEIIQSNLKSDIDFDVASNPEFLREGEAIKDFMNPDRIIAGVSKDRQKKIIQELYAGIIKSDAAIFFTDIKSSELIKYASNAMLACRVSFINEISRLCDAVGADIKEVAYGIGLDRRIGPSFLQAGVGYGGSCFGKDIRALAKTMEKHDLDGKILKSIEAVNEEQKNLVVKKLKEVLPELREKSIAILGLAFKPNTDDIREAPSIVVINELKRVGANIKACDPKANEKACRILKDVNYCNSPYEAVKGADALVILTEWDEFKNLDLVRIKSLMKCQNIIDGRNILNPEEIKEAGFKYYGVGRGGKN